MTDIYWTRQLTPPINWWVVQNGELSVKITDEHRMYKPQWCMECRTLGLSLRPLEKTNLEDAKKEALDSVKDRLVYLQMCWKDISDE